MKKLSYLVRYGWIVMSVAVVVFIASAITIYIAAKPNNVTDRVLLDTSWPNAEELTELPGDLEIYPYVTRVYAYGTNDPRIDIRFIGIEPNCEIMSGILEDPAAIYNYYIECFVVSDIADKALVRKLWNITVSETEELILTETYPIKHISYGLNDSGDLKKDYFYGFTQFTTIMRITVKPGFHNIGFSNITKEVLV